MSEKKPRTLTPETLKTREVAKAHRAKMDAEKRLATAIADLESATVERDQAKAEYEARATEFAALTQ